MRYSKCLAVAITGISMMIFLSGCNNPFDKFLKKDETAETVTEILNQSETETTELSTITSIAESINETSAEISETTKGEETGGGNPDTYKEIEITVSDNQYFYNNHEISFDELCDLFVNFDSNTSIIIYDEMASESAYTKITEYLDEQKIPYIMK